MNDYKSRMKEYISNLIKSEITALDEKAKRDYKAEYKKFQSSTKAKKYRAELNKYNRQKGTYGNGDGKDASHKGGKIVGFEAQSKNRGRAEKSRLKKETHIKENKDKMKKYLMSKGDNEKDATDILRYYDLVKKLYKGATPAKQAQIMSSLWANESVTKNEVIQKIKELKDHEGKMAKSQLERSKEYAEMIYKIIQNVDKGKGVEFPAWVQSKLTKAEDYLQSVYNYLDGKDGLEDKFQESVNENRQKLVKNLMKVYKDLDKKFKNYDHTKMRDWGNVTKHLIKKFGGNNRLAAHISHYYNDYKGGEDIKKNIDKLIKYSQKMTGKKLESVNESKSDVLKSLSEIKSLTYSLYQEMSKVQKHLNPKDARKIKKLMSKSLGGLDKSTSFIKSLSRRMESVNEYTYGVGDIVKDINPTCPHNGAMGKVKSISPKSVVFVVMNKGKNYQPGDVLDKTHDQMEKMNEGVSKSQAQEIMRQLGGRKFEMLMGVKSKGVGKDGLILHIGKNPKKVSHIIIDLSRDEYDLTFGKIYKYQFKVIKKLKGVGVEQLHDMIEKYTGLLAKF